MRRSKIRVFINCPESSEYLPCHSFIQYPFASSREGGSGASITCVPADQNTDQGTYMKFWFSEHGYLPGSGVGKKFGVEVVGISCSTVSSIPPPPKKRATVSGGGNASEYYQPGDLEMSHLFCLATVLPGGTFDNQTMGLASNRLLLPLGDADPGEYVLFLFYESVRYLNRVMQLRDVHFNPSRLTSQHGNSCG